MTKENPFADKVYDLYTELIYSSISELEFEELQKEAEKELEELRRNKNASN